MTGKHGGVLTGWWGWLIAAPLTSVFDASFAAAMRRTGVCSAVHHTHYGSHHHWLKQAAWPL
jgi:hypothetical protein